MPLNGPHHGDRGEDVYSRAYDRNRWRDVMPEVRRRKRMEDGNGHGSETKREVEPS